MKIINSILLLWSRYRNERILLCQFLTLVSIVVNLIESLNGQLETEYLLITICLMFNCIDFDVK